MTNADLEKIWPHDEGVRAGDYAALYNVEISDFVLGKRLTDKDLKSYPS